MNSTTETTNGPTSSSLLNTLIADAQKKSTPLILQTIKLIGSGGDKATRMVRAALFEVYAEREGDDAFDALFDEIHGSDTLEA